MDLALEFLVVRGHFANPASMQNVVLPAAALRKKTDPDEHRTPVQRNQKGGISPGEAKSDWEILTAVAGKMGYEDQFRYQQASDVFEESA